MNQIPNSKFRLDISDYLVHYTKGVEAIKAFKSIVDGGAITGGTGYIKGGYRCVCFTESPVHAIRDILLRRSECEVKYEPFGIAVSKAWLFEQGGRPVIYQPDDEFESLPDTLRWRHVSYNPNRNPPADFTWEREWRIKTDSLEITPDIACLVVPSVDELRLVCSQHQLTENVPQALYSWLEDCFVLEADFKSGRWATLLLSNPESGWSGIDVDLD
jgi:hypothetical protein